jgi:hypothetical protein
MLDIIEVAKRMKKDEDIIIDCSKDYTKKQKVAIAKKLEYKAAKAINYKSLLSEFKMVESDAKGYKAKLNKRLIRILKIIDELKKYRYRSGCTLLELSCTYYKYLDICGTKTTVGSDFDLMVEIGLMKVWLDKNRFGAGKENYSSCYLYFKENEDKFIKYCNDNNIFINNNKLNNNSNNSIISARVQKDYFDEDLWYVYDKDGKLDEEKYFKLLNNINLLNNNKNILLVQECEKLIDFKVEDVRFGKSKLKKADGIEEEDFEIFLNECLYENYKGLRYFQELVEEINETYYRDNEDFKLKFEASFEWKTSKKGYRYVKNIGIRLFNNLCNLRKDLRKEFLEEIHFDKEKDVKSSIGRVNYGLNTGVWLDENTVDIYKLVYDELNLKYEWNDDIRELIKSLFMRAYFDGGDKTFVNNIWRNMDRRGICVEDIRASVCEYRKAVRKVLGNKTYDSEIYYYESSLYLLVLSDLLKAGYKVWMVYDCFYCDDRMNHNLWNDLNKFDKLVEVQLIIRFDDYYRKFINGLI